MGLPAHLIPFASLLGLSAARHNLEMYLLAAVIDREAPRRSWSPQVLGPELTGDNGHGKGLGQVDERYHREWIAANDWRDPSVNLEKAAEILRGSIDVCRGSLWAGIAGYNAGPGRARDVSDAILTTPNNRPWDLLDQLDLITTGRDYVSDVCHRRARMRGNNP